ncbi:NADPH-dependent 7-cyano-7-deazaguanine reductase QueF [Piscirickettsia litoralis]|uniref:NADPH-dependent 7-cyano-7-deazaguanine reductase n=1 Tax=Piscirickettsia litoralis TaxID=1891921 RepID=A0ABX3A4A8_9GAMM|nr:NADPH-dependent 7-cyano-7-deazaguanine reductase QueF [Piscirickettsia litoralis]ODN43699.1 NADPH-dependent 7-cyano-7-deazaguanine reductase QueF [Piscirickettsia litoralis]
MSSEIELQLESAPLGQKSDYISTYSPDLLFPIPRKQKRDEINVPDALPFNGFDAWNAFELSWLNAKGKPCVALAHFEIDCASVNIVESKSFKLYLNSFNNTKFDSVTEVERILAKDIQAAAEGEVKARVILLSEVENQPILDFSAESIDDLDIECNEYMVKPDYLKADHTQIVEETLSSNLLKSNCLVTGQPDWGSVEIAYYGPKIDRESLLQYIVSFRNHNEFHEQCVERIFMDVMAHCQPERLTVHARYTRRGGLDINPVRSTEKSFKADNLRMARQ